MRGPYRFNEFNDAPLATYLALFTIYTLRH